MSTPAPAQPQTVDDNLLEKFKEYISAHPRGADVTLDEIKRSLHATVNEPGGKAYLERMLAQPSAENIIFAQAADGESAVNLKLTGLTLNFQCNGSIPGTNTKAFSMESSTHQLMIGDFPKLTSKLLYTDPVALVVANPLVASIRHKYHSMGIEIDIRNIIDGPIIARLIVYNPSFTVLDCTGDGKFS